MNTIVKLLAGIGIVFWTVLLVGILSYRFDGEIFPAVSQLDIDYTSIRTYGELGPEWTIFNGSFTDLRDDCVYVGMEWFTVEQGTMIGTVIAPAHLLDPFVATQTDSQNFKQLTVRILSDKLVNDSSADIYHDCYGGWLWLTKTNFYSTI
jgi:hypothetical protein